MYLAQFSLFFSQKFCFIKDEMLGILSILSLKNGHFSSFSHLDMVAS